MSELDEVKAQLAETEAKEAVARVGVMACSPPLPLGEVPYAKYFAGFPNIESAQAQQCLIGRTAAGDRMPNQPPPLPLEPSTGRRHVGP